MEKREPCHCRPVPVYLTRAEAEDDDPMEDDEATGPVDLTGSSDILPPLAHSTNPLYPNAIVKRPPNTHAKGGSSKAVSSGGGVKSAAAEEKKEREQREREERERKERDRKAAIYSSGPSNQTKPYGVKYTPVSWACT